MNISRNGYVQMFQSCLGWQEVAELPSTLLLCLASALWTAPCVAIPGRCLDQMEISPCAAVMLTPSSSPSVNPPGYNASGGVGLPVTQAGRSMARYQSQHRQASLASLVAWHWKPGPFGRIGGEHWRRGASAETCPTCSSPTRCLPWRRPGSEHLLRISPESKGVQPATLGLVTPHVRGMCFFCPCRANVKYYIRGFQRPWIWHAN
mmetsp:Transcript_33605/g.54028  ORF Transcript_33605/g.54028 Transcript_33605/m.54028 type:complete len:206 (+) Transcript_33605:579-1196(+)